MNIRDKLYKKENKTVPKSINIDDSLYEKIREATENIYDAKYGKQQFGYSLNCCFFFVVMLKLI